ncbi:MAG: ribonuclease Y [Geothrix sp.]|jgi:ribonuclease Y|uniref:Ribonuclease Y n=1 Tax=Candidatus Geothrix odensensis TaxID=2954440 RepID=A0A936K669_9BACT|nr:ribonuclease Y [Holophagaceae bacterium]MBK8571865.1 ribonuclease Y [Candidatus Geothrix odensensis]MBK8791519.1 ribonuclease Y [Holophagaceae bacterium]MBP7616890.1 ribonuclease Y [Geothrix sp.]
MNLISWIFLLLFFAAAGVGLLMALRAQKATAEASQAKANAESDIKAERERLLEEAKREAQRLMERGAKDAESVRKESELKAKEQALQARQEAEKLLTERQNNLEKQEQRIQAKEQGLQSKEEGLDKKVQQVDQKAKDLEILSEKRKAEIEKLEAKQAEAKQLVEEQARRLEEIAGLTRDDAKKELISQLEYSAKMDAAKMVRRIEDEAVEDAAKRARWTIGAAIQRVASDVVTEQAVSSVQLPSDDLKGRIIGREGRNIRALEKATGCDLIVDDTPESIVVSSFDPIRREVARQAILKLLADGRIHPARIEEVVEKVKVDMDQHLKEIGEAACIELGFPDVHPKLHKLVGRLNYRTSYGQNVLEHTKEVARIAEYMAGEMGADARLSRRAGLFHDIGKAIDREVEGTHIEIGMQLMQRYGEKEEVIHAMSCHHGDFEPRTVEAMLITAADALSAARPGARREMLETYVKRLEQLEGIANSYKGVQKSFAMQAGREIRILVDAGSVNDDQAYWIAKDVSRRIESEMQYPGQIKVTVMRELRAVEIAR